MNKRKSMAAGAAVIALGLLVAIAPRYLFPVCEYHGIFMQLPSGKQEHMHCFYTATASLLAGGLIGLVGLTMLLARGRETIRMLSLVLGGAAIGVILIPATLFPICQNPDMPCNQGAMPMLIVLGTVTFMTSGWTAFSSRSSAAARAGSASGTAGATDAASIY